MCSNSTNNPNTQHGNMVQVQFKNGHDKLEKWSSPRLVSDVDISAGIANVPGSNGQKIVAALEDTRMTFKDDYLASHILESIDRLDDGIYDAMDNYICGATRDLDDVQNKLADDANFTGTNCSSKSIALISTTEDVKINFWSFYHSQ